MSSQRRVLVVDDEHGIQIVLRELLDLEGYAVRVASDGRAALDILPTWRPDVILLDLMMPGMDGGAFRRAQLELPHELSSIPVVTISGARDAAQRAESMESAGFVPKPFDLDEVVATIKQVIEEHTTS